MRIDFLKWISILFLIILTLSGCSGLKRELYKSEKVSQFSNFQEAIILDGSAEMPMRIFKITNREDSVLLRQDSKYITPDENNELLTRFVARLYRTVTDSASMGVGIAAPQVGILKNIIWVQRFDKEEFPFEVYLNPKILQYSEMKQTRREGCLSIPNRTDTLHCRSYAVLIEYDKMNGEHKLEMIEDFTAIIFQHEIDHLNGILYLDHLQKEMEDARQK